MNPSSQIKLNVIAHVNRIRSNVKSTDLAAAKKSKGELESSSVSVDSRIPECDFLLPSSSLLLSFNFKLTNRPGVSCVDGVPELVVQVHPVLGP